jgi:hypothetical protein
MIDSKITFSNSLLVVNKDTNLNWRNVIKEENSRKRLIKVTRFGTPKMLCHRILHKTIEGASRGLISSIK